MHLATNGRMASNPFISYDPPCPADAMQALDLAQIEHPTLIGWPVLFLIYTLICAIPALILVVRGRGWRPRFFVLTLLTGWTGGVWIVMLCIAVLERSGNFSRDKPLPPPTHGRANPATDRRRGRKT